MKMRFFDYNSTTPPAPRVLAEIDRINREIYTNPSSLHSPGKKAREVLEESRETVAAFVGAEKDEIFFTSGGTESNNWSIAGLAELYRGKKHHIISTSVEHSSVYETLIFLEKSGWEITFLPVDGEGRIDPAYLESSIREDTAFISVMTANNETGVLQPMGEISRIAEKHRIPLHSDAVQALGKIPLCVNDPAADLMSFSAHKLYGPRGIGALYIRKGLSLPPLIHGGGQEYGRRSGTENLPAIAGFAEACHFAGESMVNEAARLRDLKQGLYSALGEKIKCIRLNGSLDGSLPNTLNISLPGCESDSLVLDLDSEGFFLSAGSACGSAGRKKSRVLKAMNLKHDEVFSALRISMGSDTEKEDIEALVASLARIVDRSLN